MNSISVVASPMEPRSSAVAIWRNPRCSSAVTNSASVSCARVKTKLRGGLPVLFSTSARNSPAPTPCGKSISSVRSPVATQPQFAEP
jgi:hypothetical protein